MLRTVRVPHELLALSQIHRASTRELGAPLFLPAFETQVLEAGRQDDEVEADPGVAAGGFSIGAEDDDDFY